LVTSTSRWLWLRYSTVSATPSRSSTGCLSIALPASIMDWMSRASILPSVTSIAVSIIDRMKPLMP
jgi:hypothetical protein